MLKSIGTGTSRDKPAESARAYLPGLLSDARNKGAALALHDPPRISRKVARALLQEEWGGAWVAARLSQGNRSACPGLAGNSDSLMKSIGRFYRHGKDTLESPGAASAAAREIGREDRFHPRPQGRPAPGRGRLQVVGRSICILPKPNK